MSQIVVRGPKYLGAGHHWSLNLELPLDSSVVSPVTLALLFKQAQTCVIGIRYLRY